MGGSRVKGAAGSPASRRPKAGAGRPQGAPRRDSELRSPRESGACPMVLWARRHLTRVHRCHPAWWQHKAGRTGTSRRVALRQPADSLRQGMCSCRWPGHPGRPRAVARRCWWEPAGLSLLPEMTGEIRRCLTEVESCFRLLVPLDLGLSPGAALPAVAPAAAEEGPPDLGDEEQPCCSRSLPACARCPAAVGAGVLPSEDEDSDQEEFVRRHGLGSRQYTLDVELSSGTLSPSCGQALPCRASWPWASGRLLSLGFLGPRRGWGPKAAASVATGPAVTGSMVRGRA